jgi:hypothetical protein
LEYQHVDHAKIEQFFVLHNEIIMSEDLELVATRLKLGRYRHYKGKFYQVLTVARHSETREWLVVYRCLYDDYSIWVRPLQMFVENIVLESGLSILRFVYVEEMSTNLLINESEID